MKQLNRETAGAPLNKPVKIIQFGEGNFLRGFIDWMVDIMNEKATYNGAIQIVRPVARGQVHVLNDQDGLFHVLLRGFKDGEPFQEKRLISCVKGSLNPYEDYEGYLKLGEDPELELIFSNTTEAGIAFDPQDTGFNTLPASFPGKLTALLYRRFKKYNGSPDKGLIIIPTELIENNGNTLKQLVLKYAEIWKLPASFARWIEEHNIFCNTLVDRIVPGYPKENIEEIQQLLGFEDKMVVVAEPYHFLAIEAPEAVREKFPAKKAGLNVEFVKDLAPFRERKVRILNGAHTIMVPVALLFGLKTVRESIEDNKVGEFIQKAVFEEIIPGMEGDREELGQYAGEIVERFRNPFIKHELMSIALNSISKFKVRVIPSLVQYHEKNLVLPERILTALAALIVFYKGSWRGRKIELKDNEEYLKFFNDVWVHDNISEICYQVLSAENIWGVDLSRREGFLAFVTNKARQFLEFEKNPDHTEFPVK